jgi:hypothetical protein
MTEEEILDELLHDLEESGVARRKDSMTLRDQFAMAALPGIIVNDTNIPEDASRYAYEMADAMLKARKDKK